MNEIATMDAKAVARVRRLEAEAMKRPQVLVETTHTFHAGVYARTVMVPAGVMLTGALIKVPTVLIVAGECMMYTGHGAIELRGYQVLNGLANRKSAFVAKTDTYLTMIFATEAKTTEEAEAEFTDEAYLLFSRRDDATNFMLATKG